MSNTDCKTPNSLEEVKKRCHRSQSYSVATNIFGDPCHGTYKYLEAHYFCIFFG